MATIDQQYIYSLGRVKELEKGLLQETNLDRVLESDDPFAVLRSIGFFKATEELEGQADHIHELFRRERVYNRMQLHELIADSPLEDIFLLPYDIHAIKLFLKDKLSGHEAMKEAAVEQGKFSKEQLVTAVYEGLPTDLPPSLVEDIHLLTEEFHNTRQFGPIDHRLDRRLRVLQLEIAGHAKSAFMTGYIRRLSDLQNIASMIRRKSLLLDREGLSDVLLDTGTLAPAFFERIYDSGWESLATAFKPTEYGNVVANALASVDQSNFLPMVDFWCSHDMLEFLRRTKQICFGIEPVLAYYLGRDHELRVVRAIWIGKRFHYPQQRLKSRVKELY